MNKIELTFGEKTYTASLGIGFLGEFQHKEKYTFKSMLSELESNPFYVFPRLMLYSINRGTKDANLSIEDVEDLIDENGGFSCQQLADFGKAFSESITTNTEDAGKSKKPIPKKKA